MRGRALNDPCRSERQGEPDDGGLAPAEPGDLWGTAKVSWCMSGRDLRIPDGDAPLTRAQIRALEERLQEALAAALPGDRVDVWIDGEDQPAVRVHFDLGDMEIEIDDGPVNGRVGELEECCDDE